MGVHPIEPAVQRNRVYVHQTIVAIQCLWGSRMQLHVVFKPHSIHNFQILNYY